MKKILVVLAVISIGMFSCKKEAEIKPTQVKNASMAGGSTTVLLGYD